jgi:hypothetical protein
VRFLFALILATCGMKPSSPTITAIHDSWACGIAIGVTRVEYGDFDLLVPCIELVRTRGLPFAVGDQQHIATDAAGRVTAITWQGKTFAFPRDKLVPVKAPVLAELGWRDEVGAADMHYEAKGWSWP